MIYRSRAPLRIGLAGGGTDVSPYSDEFGGAILNATISHYAHASIEPIEENGIIVQTLDRKEEQRFEWSCDLPIDGKLDLLKGVYNRIQKRLWVANNEFFVYAPLWMLLPAADWEHRLHWLLPSLAHCRNAEVAAWRI